MSIPLVTRGIVLLVLTALAGVLSSLLAIPAAPAYGVRGALFGAVLGLGVLVTDRLSQERLRKGQYPKPAVALVVAVLTGLVAATILLWHSTAFAQGLPNHEFGPPPWLSGGPLLAMSIAYAVLLHGIYAARGLVKRPIRTVRLGSVLAGVLCGVLRAGLTVRTGGLRVDQFIMVALFYALFTGLPFCLLWMMAVRIADPGWSPQRWARNIEEKAEG